MSDIASIAADEKTIISTLYYTATALFCYDYILTFGSEVQFMWRSKLSIAAIVFYVVRYAALFNTLFTILETLQGPTVTNLVSNICNVLIRLEMVLDLLLLIGAAVFSALRVYAIWDRNKSVFLLMLVLGLMSPAISLYQFSISTPLVDTTDIPTCGLLSGLNTVDEAEDWDFGLRASAVLADAAVLAFTWNKTFRLKAEASEAGVKTSFASILMRDGTIYFLTLLVLNIVDMVVNRLFVGEFIYPLSTWIAVMTAILMCRFMLDLHEVESSLSGDSQARSVATLVFRDEMSAEEHDVVGRVYSIVGLGEGADEESNSGDNRADGDHLVADIEKTQTRNMVAPMCVPLPQD